MRSFQCSLVQNVIYSVLFCSDLLSAIFLQTDCCKCEQRFENRRVLW